MAILCVFPKCGATVAASQRILCQNRSAKARIKADLILAFLRQGRVALSDEHFAVLNGKMECAVCSSASQPSISSTKAGSC